MDETKVRLVARRIRYCSLSSGHIGVVIESSAKLIVPFLGKISAESERLKLWISAQGAVQPMTLYIHK